VRVDVRVDRESVWLTRRQTAQLFDRTPENVPMHLHNVLAGGELEGDATTKESLAVRAESLLRRRLKNGNHDAIVSVGYWLKSRLAERFRVSCVVMMRPRWPSVVASEKYSRPLLSCSCCACESNKIPNREAWRDDWELRVLQIDLAYRRLPVHTCVQYDGQLSPSKIPAEKIFHLQ